MKCVSLLLVVQKGAGGAGGGKNGEKCGTPTCQKIVSILSIKKKKKKLLPFLLWYLWNNPAVVAVNLGRHGNAHVPQLRMMSSVSVPR